MTRSTRRISRSPQPAPASGLEMSPGFFQGHARGLQTGRVSPREMIRPAASDVALARAGLKTFAEIDPNQGQLFDTRAMGGHTPKGIADDPLTSHKGFMPSVVRRATSGPMKGEIDPVASRAAKAEAIVRLGESMARTGNATPTPFKDSMDRRRVLIRSSQERQRRTGRPNNWYAGMDESGQIIPESGHAGQLAEEMAGRRGITHQESVRATAVTSPRTHWADPAHDGSGGQVYPNIASAENVVRAIKSPWLDKVHEGNRDAVVAAAGEVHGESLNPNKLKAARLLEDKDLGPVPISGNPGTAKHASHKVPNFDASLLLDDPSVAVRRRASESYTSDVHDTVAGGGDEQLLKTDLGYAAMAMAGRRAATKEGLVGPIGQQFVWQEHIDQTVSRPMGDDGLFTEDYKGRIVANKKALPTPAAKDEHVDDRSDFAKKHGLEF